MLLVTASSEDQQHGQLQSSSVAGRLGDPSALLYNNYNNYYFCDNNNDNANKNDDAVLRDTLNYDTGRDESCRLNLKDILENDDRRIQDILFNNDDPGESELDDVNYDDYLRYDRCDIRTLSPSNDDDSDGGGNYKTVISSNYIIATGDDLNDGFRDDGVQSGHNLDYTSSRGTGNCDSWKRCLTSTSEYFSKGSRGSNSPPYNSLQQSAGEPRDSSSPWGGAPGEEEDCSEEDAPLLQRLREEEEELTTLAVAQLFSFINEGTMFDVTVERNSRGLGLSLCESRGVFAGLLRVKKLYPKMPAALCGQLQHGDILLEADGTVLSGLASHEALEVLRSCRGSGVHLLLCRPPRGTMGPEDPASCSPPPPLEEPNLLLSPVPSVCGEFEVTLTKVNKSLGFTLRKRDNSILGHTVRTLVREPALSDGRIKPGDKILSVNGADLCGLSHEEAIGILRTTPDTVVIRLYRDVTQTPVSPLSPGGPDESALGGQLKPKPLRQEARDMLSQLAHRKRSGGSSLASHGSGAGDSGTTRRRRLQKTPTPDTGKHRLVDRFESLVRRMEETPESAIREEHFGGVYGGGHERSPHSRDSCASSIVSRESNASNISRVSNTSNASDTNSLSECSDSRRKRPNFLDLDKRASCPRKSQFTPPHERESPLFSPAPEGASDEIPSMTSLDSAPPLGRSSPRCFGHGQPSYQSADFIRCWQDAPPKHQYSTSPEQHNTGLSGSTSEYSLSTSNHPNQTSHKHKTGLLKWKGAMMEHSEEEEEQEERASGDKENHGSVDNMLEESHQLKYHGAAAVQLKDENNPSSKDLKEYPRDFVLSEEQSSDLSHESMQVTITLQRGWNSRLGFSLQPAPAGGATEVVAVYNGCVAARDGRLRVGDTVVKINDADVSQWETQKVIDLLRKTHGKIDLTVLQRPDTR